MEEIILGDDTELYMEIEELEKKNAFKRYFLIDYENVNRDGLNGITKLSEDDCVRIYYSNTAETLTFGLHRRINESRAHFDYIKVQMPIKNAVDCLILFDIRDLTKKNRNAEYFIVSKDADFDRAIEEFTVRNLKVKKVLEICKREETVCKTQPKKEQLPPPHQKKTTNAKDRKEAQVRSFFGKYLKDFSDKKEEIIQIILDSKTKQQVNNGLMKLYSNEMVSNMLKVLKPLINDLPGK